MQQRQRHHHAHSAHAGPAHGLDTLQDSNLLLPGRAMMSSLNASQVLPSLVAYMSNANAAKANSVAMHNLQSAVNGLEGFQTAWAINNANAIDRRQNNERARRSCAPCRAARRACSNTRPCQRCVSRGEERKCVEGNQLASGRPSRNRGMDGAYGGSEPGTSKDHTDAEDASVSTDSQVKRPRRDGGSAAATAGAKAGNKGSGGSTSDSRSHSPADEDTADAEDAAGNSSADDDDGPDGRGSASGSASASGSVGPNGLSDDSINGAGATNAAVAAAMATATANVRRARPPAWRRGHR